MPGGGRARADFEEYAAARRPDLVRLVVLLGLPPDLAASLADRALHRARRDWRDLRDDPDPDARLLELVRDEQARDRTAWWDDESRGGTLLPSSPVPLPPLLSERLDRMPVDRRALLAWSVLGRSAALEDHVADDPSLRAELAAAAAAVVVPPPTGAVPNRRRRRGTAVVVGAVLVVAVAVSFAFRPDARPPGEEPLGPAPVSERTNPAPVAWYADGRLHLARVAVALDAVRAVVEMADGAVYVDDRGRVVRLLEDGTRTELGRADPAAGLVGSSVFGRVAWVAADGGSLEVVDVAAGEVVARRDLDPPPDGAQEVPARLLRMSGSILRYTGSGWEYEWDTAGRTFDREEQGGSRGRLLDVVGTTEVRQATDDEVVVSQRYGRELTVPGVGGEISPRQQFVLTRAGEGGTGVRVVSVATGDEVASGATRDDIVLDARFTDADRVTYLLADRAAVPDASGAGRVSSTGPLEVRTCQVRTGVCVVHTAGAGAGDSSVLLGR